MAASLLGVGIVQRAVSADREENLRATADGVRQARARGARLVVLGELFTSPYFCQTEDPEQFIRAETIPGPTTIAMSALAAECEVVLVVPLFERRAPGLYHNSLVVLGPQGETLGQYRKLHIPDDPQFFEKFYFAPGDLGVLACSTPFGSLGTLICWDQWFPEAARLAAMKGAEVIAYPTAIGWMPCEKAQEGATQLDAWRTIQRAHAIANGVFVVCANRVGFEPSSAGGIEFWGHSFVCDPQGIVLAEAGEAEEVLVAELDLDRIDAVRRWWPFFRDRRVDAYGDLTARWLGKDPG
ncbi:MAG: carbon-nitrogen hydrolase [Polyangiaceae bacterium]|nr:carbon-nitrogen hydrolase [Polyangiaceae bacterium]